jgi:two-component system, chemotaxis family, protein-glutamate methylesterase/glutaminase
MQKIVVIGASTGGPPALEEIFCNIKSKMGVPILVLQHMPPVFTASLAERLNKCTVFPVSEAKDKEKIENDHIYIVPGGFHFFLEFPGPKVHLLHESIGLSPSVDAGMVSAVDHYGPGVVGVILSGMGHDGSIGAKAIKQIGGKVIAESESSATIYGMSKEVVEAGLADAVLPIDQIFNKILEYLN